MHLCIYDYNVWGTILMCVNFDTSMENRFVFSTSKAPFLTQFLLMSSNCQGKNNFFFSTSSKQYREIGLIYVPLTERKRDKRHHETIKRKLVRCAEGDRTPVHRECTVCNFTLFLWLQWCCVIADKLSDDPASSPDPLWKHSSLCL